MLVLSERYLMSYSVVIPTNRSFHHIEPLLVSLAQQTLIPWQLIIVLDRSIDIQELEEYTHRVKQLFLKLKKLQIDIISYHNDKKFHVGKWASYVRNYGRKKVIHPDMMFVDDDNVFDDERSLNLKKRPPRLTPRQRRSGGGGGAPSPSA